MSKTFEMLLGVPCLQFQSDHCQEYVTLERIELVQNEIGNDLLLHAPQFGATHLDLSLLRICNENYKNTSLILFPRVSVMYLEVPHDLMMSI